MKTPKQMLLLSLASFIIPVFIIIGLVFYVTSANKTAPGSSDAGPDQLLGCGDGASVGFVRIVVAHEIL